MTAEPDARASWGDVRARKDGEDPQIALRAAAAATRLDFAQLVYDVRTGAGLTQRELAELMGTQQPAIARIESAGTTPTVELLQRLVAAVDGSLTVRVEVAGRRPVEVRYPHAPPAA